MHVDNYPHWQLRFKDLARVFWRSPLVLGQTKASSASLHLNFTRLAHVERLLAIPGAGT